MKLYKRTATGATQVWWQEVVGSRYRTHSGQEGGQIVTSEWTICVGKNIGRINETTPEQQAGAESCSHYAKKRKAGYVETVVAAQKSTRFSPMLAQRYENCAHLVDALFDEGGAVYSQPKLDGIRCIGTASGLRSRQGNPIVAVPHIAAAVQSFCTKYPGVILDGELYAHRFRDDFNAIVSLVKKTKPTEQDFRDAEDLIEYHVYDAAGTVADESFSRRFDAVQEVTMLRGSVRPVETLEMATAVALDQTYEHYLSAGYEGQMVRLDGPYEQKRSKLLLKRKEFLDHEFRVVAIEEGQGNKSGMAGYAVLELAMGKTFRANIMGDRAFLRHLLEERADYVGKEATVVYFKPTPDGVPRFPRIKAFHPERRL
jgi:DNA ligase 1